MPDGANAMRGNRNSEAGPRLNPVFLITFITTMNHVCFTGMRFTLLLYAIHLGASSTTVGVLGALFAILSALTLVGVGRWADRSSPRGPMIMFSVVQGTVTLLPALWPSMTALFIAATLIGWFYNAFWVFSQQIVGRISTTDNRASNYSVVTMGLAASSFLGPVLAGFSVDHLGFPVTLMLAAALPIGPAILIGFKAVDLPAPRQHAPVPQAGTSPASPPLRHGVFSLLRIPRLRRVLIVAMSLAGAWDFFVFLMPIYGTQLHLSASTMGMLFGAFTCGVFVIRIFMPMLSRHVAPWRLLLVSLATGCVGYVLLPAAPGVPLMMAVALILGLGLGMQLPITSALLYEYSPPDRGGESIGLRVMLVNVNATILPLAAGAISDLIGVIPVFLLAALILLGIALQNRHMWRHHKAASASP